MHELEETALRSRSGPDIIGSAQKWQVESLTGLGVDQTLIFEKGATSETCQAKAQKRNFGRHQLNSPKLTKYAGASYRELLR